MLTAPLMGLFAHVKAGSFDPADILLLEHMAADQFLAEVASSYRFQFQERQWKNKWEISVARSLRTELIARRFPDSVLVSLFLVPVYRQCLFLSGEGSGITGITVASRLAVEPVRKPAPGLRLTTGRGFKLDKGPDGWAIRPFKKRTVRLTETFLRSRGWRFDHLGQLVASS